MLRYDRPRFAALVLPCLLNGLALPLHALGLATSASWVGAEDLVPLELALAVVCLLLTLPVAVRRGRDLGWSAPATLALVVIGFGIFPLVLLVFAVLLCAGRRAEGDRFGPSPLPPPPSIWLVCAALLAWPWVVIHVARALS